MKILKPNFWQDKINILAILIFPISLLFQIFSYLRKKCVSPKKFNIPIICVGNIYLGGTGKTPLAIFISNQLKNIKKAVIIKKFYKTHKDEFRLIESKSEYLITGNKRDVAITEARDKNFDLVILDDGFQDFSIKKNLDIVCFNSKQLVGNGMVFPSGPLRERMSSLTRAQIVVINGEKNIEFEKKILDISSDIKIYYSKYLPLNIENFRNRKLLAFAGIGNPQNFFDLLKMNNLDIKKTLSFPDHYEFTRLDIQNIVDESRKTDCEIITTEKDYLRIKDYGFKNIKFLELELQIFEKDQFINQILKYI